LGSGRQWWSWVSLHDTVASLAHLVDHPEVTGPVNVVAPEPVRQREVARALGHALHRPAVLPAPAFGVRWVLGGFADEVLTSKRVSPSLLITSGFTHRDTDLAQLVRAEVGR
jgi:NAD dependent epimerase/dehydratase family enzyme